MPLAGWTRKPWYLLGLMAAALMIVGVACGGDEDTDTEATAAPAGDATTAATTAARPAAEPMEPQVL